MRQTCTCGAEIALDSGDLRCMEAKRELDSWVARHSNCWTWLHPEPSPPASSPPAPAQEVWWVTLDEYGRVGPPELASDPVFAVVRRDPSPTPTETTP